jgi:hypothetical protein
MFDSFRLFACGSTIGLVFDLRDDEKSSEEMDRLGTFLNRFFEIAGTEPADT